ncbi:MAG: tyrosine-type recombinase/integrase [Pseudomonadota bacterium]
MGVRVPPGPPLLLFLISGVHDKTGRKVVRPIDPAIAELQKLPGIQNNPYVVIGAKEGAHLTVLQRPWRRIQSKARRNDVRRHDLRHSFTSFAVNSGASLPMIGGLLGHTQTETTARYARIADHPLQKLSQYVGCRINKALNRDVER